MKTRKYYLTGLSLCTAGVLAANEASAAIALIDTIFDTSSTQSLLYTVDGSALDTSGATKIVVTLASEGVSGRQSDPNPIQSFTFGGVDLEFAAANSNSESSIYYLDLAGQTLTGTDFVLQYENAPEPAVRGIGLAALSLSGTADGVSATGFSSSTIQSIEPLTDGEFLVASYARNNNQSPAVPVTSGLIEIYDLGIGAGGLTGFTGAALYKENLSAGAQDIQIDGMNGSGATVLATFEAANVIPEPASGAMALIGLGALALRRRRG